MARNREFQHRPAYAWLLVGTLLAALSLPSGARAGCEPATQGTCSGHPACGGKDSGKSCRDTFKKNNGGYWCECRKGKDDRVPVQAEAAPVIDLNIGVGIGGGGGDRRRDSGRERGTDSFRR